MAYNTWASYNAWGERVPVSATFSFTSTVREAVSSTANFTSTVKESVSQTFSFTSTILVDAVISPAYDFTIPAQRVTITFNC